MDKDMKAIMIKSVPNIETAARLIERLFDVARPTAVFSDPVTTDDATVITASETHIGMGFGFGGGGGAGPVEDESEAGEGGGFGSGGGGGGSAVSRPVAAIIITGGKVRVEPIVDPTKIALAFFTTLGAIFAIGAKIRRQARQFTTTT